MRGKLGLKFMDKFAKKFRLLLKILTPLMILIGFVGMIFTSYILVSEFIKVIMVPNTPAAFSPVIPGVKVPGTQFFIPFVSGIVSIFISASIHEFSHGIVARYHAAKVKHSGFGVMVILFFAFVELDVKEIEKMSPKKQLGIFAAGPFANILLAFLVVLFMSFVMGPVAEGLVDANGVELQSVIEGFPADQAGLVPGDIITEANGVEIVYIENLTYVFQGLNPGDEIIVKTSDKTITVVTTENPENKSKAHVGITFTQNSEFNQGKVEKYGEKPIELFFSFASFLFILYAINLGIGLFNLMPLGFVDGGRMVYASLLKFLPKKKAFNIWKNISLMCLFLLLVDILLPLFRTLF